MVLPAPVGADDPHDAARREEKGQAVDEKAVAVTLDQFLGVHHPVARPGPGWDGDLQGVSPPIGGLGLGHEVVVGVDASLALALTGPRGHPDPLQLTPCPLACLIGLLFPGQSGLLLLEPR